MALKKFGRTTNNLVIPANEHAKWTNKGWLGQDGICRFPREVEATLAGIKMVGLPGSFWNSATKKDIEDAVKQGAIKFVDGNGTAMTRAQYIAKYPEYPDPLYVAQVRGLIPPNKKDFVRIGKGI